MPGMRHRKRINWRTFGRAAAITAAAATLGLLTLGLLTAAGISSYDNLFHLAASRGVPIPHLSPLEIDAGLVVVIALDITLTWLGHPIGGLRMLARVLGIGTIAANVAAGWPDTGRLVNARFRPGHYRRCHRGVPGVPAATPPRHSGRGCSVLPVGAGPVADIHPVAAHETVGHSRLPRRGGHGIVPPPGNRETGNAIRRRVEICRAG